MANNYVQMYVQMSEVYALTDKQVQWVEKFLDDCRAFDGPVDFTEPLDETTNSEDVRRTKRLTKIFGDSHEELENIVVDALSELNLSKKDKTLWVNGDEYVNVDMVVAVLQAMLKETRDTSFCTGTWAATCSKPRVGEFGGGWFAVSAKSIDLGNSWDAAEKAVKKMAKKTARRKG